MITYLGWGGDRLGASSYGERDGVLGWRQSMTVGCPLCGGDRIYGLPQQPGDRTYYRCTGCALIFVRPHHWLTPEAEKAEYDRHQNHPQDQGYRRFLSRLAEPLLNCLPPHSQGLDFGCGPGPTLSVMLTEAGHSVALYDPFYAANAEVLERVYDFVTATEVVEHLRHPQPELDRLWGCVRPGGLLGLMTKLSREDAAFATWHYKSDPTHICFFAPQTFEWLRDRWRADLTLIGADVILLRKRS